MMNSVAYEKSINTVQDGIIDRDIYFDNDKTPVRVLFVLKEANDPNGGGWDLCEYVREGGRWQTWNNVTRWAIALGATDVAYDVNTHINNDMRKNVLSHVAVVNLKKVPGGNVSCTDEIRAAAKANAAALKEQIIECEPNVIVCCGAGVADGLESTFAESDLYWFDSLGHRFGTCGNALVLDFWHPAARKNKTKMVNDISQLYFAAKQVW